MAFLVEVLAGLLTGGGFAHSEQEPPFANPSFMIALDVERFRALPDFQRELEGLIAYLQATPAREGESVFYPGEIEARNEHERQANGIPLPHQTVENLQGELDRAGVNLKLEAYAMG